MPAAGKPEDDAESKRAAVKWGRRILLSALVVAAPVGLTLFPCNQGVAGMRDGATDSTVPIENGYKLGPQDKVRVMVFEWRPARDEVYAWKALNGQYTIGTTGKLALPLLGEIPAAGSSTGELAIAIGEQLKNRMGLAAPPDTAVEIVQFRPFYVTGSVQKPDAYPFRPGLTVLQAVSISGGMMRNTDASLMRFERDALATRGEIEFLAAEHDTVLARKSRLEAELSRASEITFPRELEMRANAVAAAARIVEQENMVFKARKDAFDTQSTILKQLKEYLEKEVETITGQVAAHQKEIDALKQELDAVRSLEQKGLATTSRKLELERSLAQLEGEGMRLEGNLVKVRQDISRNDISMVELENKRSGDVTIELQNAQIKLEEVANKTDTAKKLLYEAEVIAPQSAVENTHGRKIQPQYKIVRVTAAQVVELTAMETTPLQPGDTLKVEIPLQDVENKPQPETTGTEPNSLPLPPGPKRAALDESNRLMGITPTGTVATIVPGPK